MLKFILYISLLVSHISQASSIILETPTEKIPFDTLKGKWIFIQYWATWCPPCLDEIAVFNRFYQKHQKENMALFAVNYDGLSANDIIQTARQHQIKYPSLIKDPATSLKIKEIRSLPALFIFNPEGQLHTVRYGEISDQKLSQYYQHLKQGS